MPRQEPDQFVTPPMAKPKAEDETAYQILARRAGEDPSDEDEQPGWVIFRALGHGATRADAQSDARKNAYDLASNTRNTTIESHVTSVEKVVVGPDGVLETTDFSSSVALSSSGEFSEADVRAVPCSVQRSDGWFDAAAELAVPFEQVYPYRTLERRSQVGIGAVMDFARESKGRGDVQIEFAAYDRALSLAQNTEVIKEVIKIVGDRWMELGDSGRAADLYDKWHEKFPDWTEDQASSTGRRAVQGHCDLGQYEQALSENRIWGRFDLAWAAEAEEDILLRLDTPDQLIEDLKGVVRLTEVDRDHTWYYHPDDDRFSARVNLAEVTVTRIQRITMNFPEGWRPGAIRIDDGMVLITPDGIRSKAASAGRPAEFKYGYDQGLQREYREGLVDCILFFEPMTGAALTLPAEGGAAVNELNTSALDGEGRAALKLRESLREFIEHLRAEIKSGHIKAMHLKWIHL